jgi:hypothetical protein
MTWKEISSWMQLEARCGTMEKVSQNIISDQDLPIRGRHAIQELVLNNEYDQDITYGFRLFGDVNIVDGLSLRVSYGGDFVDYFEK